MAIKYSVEQTFKSNFTTKVNKLRNSIHRVDKELQSVSCFFSILMTALVRGSVRVIIF